MMQVAWIAVLFLSAPPNPLSSDFSATAGSPDLEGIRNARVLIENGEGQKALPLLKSDSAVISDYQNILRAKARIAAKQPDQAIQILSEITPRPLSCGEPDAIYEEAIALKAQTLAQNEPIAAAKIFETLPHASGALAKAAALYRIGKNERAAKAVEARMLVEVPESPAGKALAKILGPKGVQKRLASTKLRLKRLRKLLFAHDNAAAAEGATRWLKTLKGNNKLRCELLYVAGKANRKMRRYSPALQYLEKAKKICWAIRSKNLALKSALLETRVRSIRKQVQGTRKSIKWLKKRGKQHAYVDDALHMLGRLLEDSGHWPGAQKTYQEIIQSLPLSDHAHLAAWRLAHHAIIEKNQLAAEEFLGWILSTKAPFDHKARARYWLATLWEGGRERQARKLYDQLSEVPSFYTWLALSRLRRTRPVWYREISSELLQIPTAINSEISSKLQTRPEYQRARHFADVGHTDLAKSELLRLNCARLSVADALFLALAFDAAGFTADAQRIFRSHPSLLKAVPMDRHGQMLRWYTAYSRPYWKAVQAAAKAEKIDPLLLLSLSREESTFDPEIISWAGATGLAQLMPATAAGAYRLVFGGTLKSDALFDPGLNLRLGAHVLKDGLRRFKGSEALALVAYNGGPQAAHRLTKAALPFDLWVESIPVRETRRYVRRVLETYGIYRLLYSVEDKVLELPETMGG